MSDRLVCMFAHKPVQLSMPDDDVMAKPDRTSLPACLLACLSSAWGQRWLEIV